MSIAKIEDDSKTSKEMQLSAQSVRQALILMKHLSGSYVKFDTLFKETCSDLFENRKRRIMLHRNPMNELMVLKDVCTDLTVSLKKNKGYVFNEDSKAEKYRDVGQMLIWNPSHGERETHRAAFVDRLSPIVGAFTPDTKENSKNVKVLPRVIVTVVLNSSFHTFKRIVNDEIEWGTYEHVLCCDDNSQESLLKIFEIFDKI
jgi:hypothetical protein